MLEQLYQAVGVEDVPTGQSGAGLIAELLGVADRAEFVLSHALKVASCLGAVPVQARHALALLLDSFASVAALLVLFPTEFLVGFCLTVIRGIDDN